MSRLVLVTSFVLALTGSAVADPAPRFAQPPTVAMADHPSTDRAAPTVVSRAAVRAKLARARAANVERFRAYQQAGSFPSNTYRRGSLNVWIDDDGKRCAAATIIHASGQRALVEQVGAQDNFLRLGDVTSGPLLDWILTSGLTQDEIAAIQEPFIGVDGGMRDGGLVVDPQQRATEDRRLAAKYQQVDRAIAKQRAASLDAATARLMARPALARRFLAR